MLKAHQLSDSGVREMTAHRFAREGIAPTRLILDGFTSRADYLAAYNHVDLGLDPFPYPGGTTTVEGYWMGVPTVTRRGDRFLAHNGETIAQNAGLADWIAESDDDYCRKSSRLGSRSRRARPSALGTTAQGAGVAAVRRQTIRTQFRDRDVGSLARRHEGAMTSRSDSASRAFAI